MSELRTRQPTGKVAYPLLSVEGEDKTGKTFAALSLTASERIGRSFVIELDEPTADEYAALGDYEIVEHGGTYSDVLNATKAVTKVARKDDLPNCLVLDTGSALWDGIKAWADHRARGSRSAQKILRDDPDAEISVPMNIWTDAANRWGNVVSVLRRWDGIAVVVCRATEVSKVDKDGRPVQGQTEWSIQAHKSWAFTCSARVAMSRPHHARLVAVRSLNVDVPQGGLLLPEANPLEHLIFDVLGAGGFQKSSAVAPQVGSSVAKAKNDLIELCRELGAADPKAMASAVWPSVVPEGTEDVSDDLWARIETAAREVA